MDHLNEFTGGVDSVRTKLNEMVKAINGLKNIRGDETFIAVRTAPSGITVSLNINQVLSRIPKQWWSGFFPVLIKVDGGVAGDMNTSTSVSFTYSLYDLDEDALLLADGITPITGVTPKVFRVSNCFYNTPSDFSIAIAYLDENFVIQLYDVAEERIPGQVVTNLLALQILDSTQEIQVQTQDQLVLDYKDPNDWATIYTGDTCPSGGV